MSAPGLVFLPETAPLLTVAVEDALLCEIAQAQAATDQALERLRLARRTELAARRIVEKGGDQ